VTQVNLCLVISVIFNTDFFKNFRPVCNKVKCLSIRIATKLCTFDGMYDILLQQIRRISCTYFSEKAPVTRLTCSCNIDWVGNLGENGQEDTQRMHYKFKEIQVTVFIWLLTKGYCFFCCKWEESKALKFAFSTRGTPLSGLQPHYNLLDTSICYFLGLWSSH